MASTPRSSTAPKHGDIYQLWFAGIPMVGVWDADAVHRVAGEIFTGIRDPEQMAVLDRALTDFWYVQYAFVKSEWLSPTFRRAKRGLATLVETLAKLMPERRAAGGVDLLSRLCSVEEREGLGDDDVIRLFVNIMGAAFDTTSAG